MKITFKDIAILLTLLLSAALILAGYLHNAYQVAVFSESLGMELLRAIGIIVFPLGIVMGFL